MLGKHRMRATAYSSILSLSSKPFVVKLLNRRIDKTHVIRRRIELSIWNLATGFDVSHILCDRLMMIHKSSRVGELIFGSVVQRIEHWFSKPGVAGLNPAGVTITAPSYIGSTHGFGPCGRGSTPLGVTKWNMV